ncbi:MAG: hypothetical protein NT038_05420 [Euryarchaeota archaeon]|nr:hypothetical protein [Euryarchaeota archaeon]
MELKYVFIIISLLGIGLLYVCSLFAQPTVITLETIDQYEGKHIIAEGTVTRYYLTPQENQIILIQDMKATKNIDATTLFVDTPTNVEYGDYIRVTGTVQKYNGKWEIIADEGNTVCIITKWQNITCPLWQIAEYPQRYINTNIHISGTIQQLSEDSFLLTDDTGTYSFPVLLDPATDNALSLGDAVSVHATIIYEAATLRYYLSTSDDPQAVVVESED